MNITTKFQPGDTVFRMHENKVQECDIQHIEIHVRPCPLLHASARIPQTEITYWVDGEGPQTERRVHESCVFATKAELLASL